MIRVLWCASFFVLSCGTATATFDDPTAGRDEANQDIVGGRAEAGYAATGYLMVGADRSSLGGPTCTATLIAPDVIVTAAHCVRGKQAVAFGLGAVGSSALVHGARIWANPGFDPNGQPRSAHDVAIVILERAVGSVTPAVIGTATVGTPARTVGYGRVTVGDYSVQTGYTRERKSSPETIRRIDSSSLYTTGIGGSTCWGDSGGPLMLEGGNTIFGVNADFDGAFVCANGNSTIFTSLVGEDAFIRKAIACGRSTDAACLSKPSCQYRCADYGYAANQCSDGWSCESDGCLVAKSCASACRYRCSDFGYAPGQCLQGWKCGSDGCLVSNGCTTCQYACADFGVRRGQCVQGWFCDGACLQYTNCR